MKKLLAVVSLVGLLAPSMALAAGSHPMAGCGLGYVLFGNSDNSKVMQIFAGTTNTTFGNQTFGISSGTSGCTEDGAVKFVKEVDVYVEVNLDSLRGEMSRGQGEFVETFASLIGTNPNSIPTMLKVFQDNYASIFPTSETSSIEMLENLSAVLKDHTNLLS